MTRDTTRRSAIARWRIALCVCSALSGGIGTPIGVRAEDPTPLAVFQDLEELTRRIPRMAEKPHDLLIDADGYYQSETVIFRDTKTGHEVWALTQEYCTELANIERRPVWSADGSVFSLKGNRAYRKPDGTIHKTAWTGHNYLMEGDLTRRRKLWVRVGDELVQFNAKFDTWSNVTPRRLYYVIEDKLYSVDVGHGERDNVATLLYTFPNNRPKILQNIADNDLLLVQDKNGDALGEAPLFYVIDAKRDPKDPLFVRSRSFNLGGITGIDGHDPREEFHVHSILINRAGTRVSWNYGPADSEGEYVGWTLNVDDFDAAPTPSSSKLDPFGQYMSHPGVGVGDRIAYFGGYAQLPGGTKTGGWGIWVRQPSSEDPIYIGGPAPGGHATWAGFDPDWFFANVSRDWPDKTYAGTIVAGSPRGAEGKPELRILAHAYDRQRGGKAGFDGIPRPTQSPDGTKCWFHSSMLMPTDALTGSYIVVFRRPHAPTSLSLANGDLTWTPHALSREVKSWIVYRKDGEAWRQVAELPRGQTIWHIAEPGEHMVTAVEWSGMESDVSSPTIDSTTADLGVPVRNWDVNPPSPPTSLTITTAPSGRRLLSWVAPPEDDIRHYHLYCSSDAPPEAAQHHRFASPPAGTTSYEDWSGPRGRTHYAITAVDRLGNESKPMHAIED